MNEFSTEYGKALYLLSVEENKEEKLYNELTLVKSLLEENPDYIKLLDTPAISLDKRLSLAEEAFSSFDEITCNFIKILTEKKLMCEFIKCEKEFSKLYDKSHNIERITAVSAVELTEEQIDKLTKNIEKKLNKKVFIKNEVSKDILGGIILKLNDKEIDKSVKTALIEIENKIKNTVC